VGEHTIDEVAELTGISVRSVRNYLRLYREFLHPGRGACNSLLFRDQDVETLVRIRARLRQGETREQIRERLDRGQEQDEMTVVRRPDPATPAEAPPPETALAPRGLAAAIDRQTELMERILAENLALRERISRLERHLTAELMDPRRRPVRRRSGALEIRLPYFLLRAGDGARALVGALATLLPGARTRRELAPPGTRRLQR
jgi:DNA-binding transcriptional MerR regulator